MFLEPLELKSDEQDSNKKVLGETNYLAPVIPRHFWEEFLIPKDAALELKQEQSLVQEKTNLYAFAIPLEPEQNLVLGDNQNNSFPLGLEPTTKRKASGWLERYTKSKKLKGGAIATYPSVEGERSPNNSEHWYWMWRYELKDSSAASSRGYRTKAFHIEISKVIVVKSAIAQGLGIDQILSIVRS